MGLLDRFKSLLGMGERDRDSDDVDVTVERAGAPRGETDEPPTPPTDGEDADESAGDDEDTTDESEASQTGPAAEDVTTIKGIGPAYAERLAGVGVETVGDLAAADPAEVAAETDLSETRVSGWVERAQVRVR